MTCVIRTLLVGMALAVVSCVVQPEPRSPSAGAGEGDRPEAAGEGQRVEPAQGDEPAAEAEPDGDMGEAGAAGDRSKVEPERIEPAAGEADGRERAVEPPAGPVGTEVTIWGDFAVAMKAHHVAVGFHGGAPVPPKSIAVDHIVVDVPPDARSGPVRVHVNRRVIWTGEFEVTGADASGQGND